MGNCLKRHSGILPGGSGCLHNIDKGECPMLNGKPCTGNVNGCGASTARAKEYLAEHKKKWGTGAKPTHNEIKHSKPTWSGSTGEGHGHLSDAQAKRKSQGPSHQIRY